MFFPSAISAPGRTALFRCRYREGKSVAGCSVRAAALGGGLRHYIPRSVSDPLLPSQQVIVNARDVVLNLPLFVFAEARVM